MQEEREKGKGLRRTRIYLFYSSVYKDVESDRCRGRGFWLVPKLIKFWDNYNSGLKPSHLLRTLSQYLLCARNNPKPLKNSHLKDKMMETIKNLLVDLKK